MKVITPGREQKGWSEEFYCTGEGNSGGGCGAKLLIEQGDLFRTRSSHMGETEEFITFKCCECGVLTDIERDFPSYILSSIHIDQNAWWKSLRMNDPNKLVSPDRRDF